MKNLNLKDASVSFEANLFTQQEADQLFATLLNEIAWQQDSIKMYGKEINLPRLTAWYGDQNKVYKYSGITMKPQAWTPGLLAIKERIEKLAGVEFNSVLLNLYRTGKDSVSWHSDDEPELADQPVIGSVSLGGSRNFQLKHKTKKELGTTTIELNNGSFLLMAGSTQENWLHQIPKTAKEVKPRINLTFRVIKDLQ